MVVSAILLDVNETLFSIAPLERRFESVGLDRSQARLWFARVLRDGFALAATDVAETFPAIGSHHLEQLLVGADLEATEEVVGHVLAAFEEVTPHPDVDDGLHVARRAGVEVVTLTNGTTAVTRSFLERAGLVDLVDATLEARESGVWKPHRRAYWWAADQLGRDPAELMLVAVHPWDVHGAIAAGLTGAWLDRDGDGYPPYFHIPEVRAATLGSLITAAIGGQGESDA